jgi:hypothetical protein
MLASSIEIVSCRQKGRFRIEQRRSPYPGPSFVPSAEQLVDQLEHLGDLLGD